LSAGVGIEGTDADEAVDAGFGLEIAECVIADDAQGGIADAGFFVAQFVEEFDLEAMSFGPAGVVRMSICAQSQASVPPAPAWILT